MVDQNLSTMRHIGERDFYAVFLGGDRPVGNRPFSMYFPAEKARLADRISTPPRGPTNCINRLNSLSLRLVEQRLPTRLGDVFHYY